MIVTPADLFRMLLGAFNRAPGASAAVPGGLWQGAKPADSAGSGGAPWATFAFEGDESEGVSDGRLIFKGTVTIDVWGKGAAQGTDAAVRRMADAFKRSNLTHPANGRLLVWKPVPWTSVIDDRPNENGDWCDTGLRYRVWIETRGD